MDARAAKQTLVSELDRLVSEERNPRTVAIDLQPTAEILSSMNREDRLVPEAVGKVLPQIAAAVDRIVEAFGKGGRLIYMGAGTSGRLGVLDASECPPTFGIPAGMVVGLIAGGPDALTNASEGAEDDDADGARALRDIGLNARDVVVGIAVSGRTPYVIGGLTYARGVGATTVALSCNPAAVIGELADISIAPVVGPEVLTGSTRLKSGTAQKLVLNMLTTASMIRIGKSYQNLMVDLRTSNKKLVARAVRMVMQATDCDEAAAETALQHTHNDVKLAILTIATGLGVPEAQSALATAGGFLRKAIEAHAPTRSI